MSDPDAQLLIRNKSIRPILDIDDVIKLIKEYYGFNVVHIVELDGYDDKNYRVQQNNENCDSKDYVFKVINVVDSSQPEIFEAQTSLLSYLGQQGIHCPKPVKSRNGNYLEIVQLTSGQHIIRLLKFISGTTLYKVAASSNLYYEVGEMVANLDLAMKNFHHSAYENRDLIWMMDSVTNLPHFIHAVRSEQRIKLVEEVLKQFETRITHSPYKFEKGMIHGDVNEQNILVEKNETEDWKIKAIIDFGDCHYGYYLYELAIAITYMIVLAKNVDVGGYVLAGFLKVMNISETEYSQLKVCVATRLCQSLVLGAHAASLDPSNKYVMITSENGWEILEKLWAIPEKDLLERWRNIANSFLRS